MKMADQVPQALKDLVDPPDHLGLVQTSWANTDKSLSVSTLVDWMMEKAMAVESQVAEGGLGFQGHQAHLVCLALQVTRVPEELMATQDLLAFRENVVVLVVLVLLVPLAPLVTVEKMVQMAKMVD